MLGLLFSKRSFLRRSGYLKSTLLRRPCMADGSPMPWMNYGVVAFLEERLNKDLSLFEYGSGNSTSFFAQRVKNVVSVEDDRIWYEYCFQRKPENVELVFCEDVESGEYARAIMEPERKFDVVVVDGKDRMNCMVIAKDRLTRHGVIILDDSDSLVASAGTRILLGDGFRRLEFIGVKPGGMRFYRTTILYRDGNCLGI